MSNRKNSTAKGVIQLLRPPARSEGNREREEWRKNEKQKGEERGKGKEKRGEE